MVLKRKRLSRLCWLFLGLSMLLLCSCNNSSSNGDSTGSVTFNLDWKSGTTDQPDLILSAAADVCTDYQITAINAAVYDAANTSVAAKSFTCSDHTGSFSEIPAGTGYKLIIKGMVSGSPDWTGQATGLTITDGQTTNAGTISMTYGGSDTTSPKVTKVYPDASVSEMPVDAVITALFNEAMSESTISTTTFTLEKTSDSSSVAGQISYDSTSMTATFTPDANLEPGLKYMATLTTDIQDIAGNPLAGRDKPDGSYTWLFITGTTACTYTLSFASKTFTNTGGSGVISITGSSDSCAWTAQKTDNWITFDSAANGTGISGTLNYSVAAYTGTGSRSGNIIIAGETFVVKQNPPGTSSCTYTLSFASKTFTNTGGSGVISITGSSDSCAWTAQKTDNWITFDSAANGTGISGTLNYSVAAYTGTGSRSGNIIIAGETFVVKQNPPSSMPAMIWDTHKWDEVVWQ